MATPLKTLASCTLKNVDKLFKTREAQTLPSLTAWLTMPESLSTTNLSDFERQSLLHYQQQLVFNVHDWNEHELDAYFIGPLFTLVNFSTIDFNHFGQREVDALVDGIRLYGRVDGMVASGRREPEQPYFAFEEYKRNLDPDGDPAGQCLGAMLAGQTLNRSDDPAALDQPMYGCYVVGNSWQFMTLEGRQYAFSKGFLATTDDIFDIFCILKALKTIVIERVAEQL